MHIDTEGMRKSFTLRYTNELGEEVAIVPEKWKFMPNFHGRLSFAVWHVEALS